MQGLDAAQTILGVRYLIGRGVPKNFVQAHMLFNLAASSHLPGELRDQAVKNLDIIAKRMTPAQIAEAQQLAREWKPKKGPPLLRGRKSVGQLRQRITSHLKRALAAVCAARERRTLVPYQVLHRTLGHPGAFEHSNHRAAPAMECMPVTETE